MPEFFTVTKGKEKLRVTESELPEFEKKGWSLSGKKRVTTEFGERTVEAGEARKRITTGEAEGFVDQDVIRQRRGEEFAEEKFGDDNVQTFGESALSSLTFGAFDPGDLAGFTEGDPGAAAARAKASPGVSAAGSVTGAVVGALAPGGLGRILPGGIAARAATKVGKRVLGATGSKVAGLAAEGAIDGAFFGAGQAYANAVIADTPVNVENIVGSMASEALFGGIAGGALGAAVGGLGKLSRRIDAKKAVALKSSDDLAKAQAVVDDATDALAKATSSNQKAIAQRTLDKSTAKAAKLGAREADNSVRQLNKYADKLADAPNVLDLSPEQFNKASLNVVRKELLDPSTTKASLAKFGELKAPQLPDDQFIAMANEMGIKVPDIAQAPGAHTLARAYVARKSIDDVSLAGASTVAEQQAAKSTADAAQATATRGDLALEKTLKNTELGRIKREAGPSPSSASSALGGVVGNRLGGVYRAIKAGPEKIRRSVDSFIKFAGKPRRGTVPAASAILGKLRFDPELGENPKGKSRKASFERISKELDSIAGNPEKAKQRISEGLLEVQTLKPSMAEALASKAMERMMMLHGLLPRNPNVSAFGPDRWSASQTEIDKFARIAAAAEDPYSILDDMNSGRLTQEAVDTVKQLYPEIYHSIQMELVNNAAEIKENVGYVGRLQLGIMFQVPTDVVLQPEFIKSMQTNYAIRTQEQEQSGGGNQFSTPGSNQKAVAAQATTSQRIEGKQ